MSWYRYKDGAMVPEEDPSLDIDKEFGDTVERIGYSPQNLFGDPNGLNVEIFRQRDNHEDFLICFNTYTTWYPVFVAGWFEAFSLVAKLAPMFSLSQMELLQETIVETRDTLNPGVNRWRARTS